LQIDDGAGNFTDVFGLQKDTLALSASVKVKKGITYAFRYRAKNIYGWGDFSPLTFILAADKPSQPAKPTFVSATDNSLSVRMYPSIGDFGAFVTNYYLEIDQGTPNSLFA
jgi:hypothetical protein